MEERATGLYKGLGGSLVQVVPNVALNLCAYETLRSYWMAHHADTTSPGLAHPSRVTGRSEKRVRF